MLGVGELIAPQQWQRLAPLLSVRQALGYNFNVMPPAVLSAVVGLPESAMMPVVEGRREQPIWSLNRLAMLTGVHVDLDEMSLVEYPSQFMRISAWNPAAGALHRTGIELTPFGERVPWRKDYAYSEPVPVLPLTLPDEASERDRRTRAEDDDEPRLPTAPAALLGAPEPEQERGRRR